VFGPVWFGFHMIWVISFRGASVRSLPGVRSDGQRQRHQTQVWD